jgi:hypothetical protein
MMSKRCVLRESSRNFDLNGEAMTPRSETEQADRRTFCLLPYYPNLGLDRCPDRKQIDNRPTDEPAEVPMI